MRHIYGLVNARNKFEPISSKNGQEIAVLAQNRDFLGHFGTSLTPRTPSTGGFNSDQPKNEQKEYQILIS